MQMDRGHFATENDKASFYYKNEFWRAFYVTLLHEINDPH